MELELKLLKHGTGGMFYIKQALIEQHILKTGKKYKITLEE